MSVLSNKRQNASKMSYSGYVAYLCDTWCQIETDLVCHVMSGSMTCHVDMRRVSWRQNDTWEVTTFLVSWRWPLMSWRLSCAVDMLDLGSFLGRLLSLKNVAMGLCLLKVTTLDVVRRRLELGAILGQLQLDATYDVMMKKRNQGLFCWKRSWNLVSWRVI